MLREKQIQEIRVALEEGKISSRRGLNQEVGLRRPGDIHYDTIISVVHLFSSILEILEFIVNNGSTQEQRAEAFVVLEAIQDFNFVFTMHFMRKILAVSNELSQSLQRKDQDIANAMQLVKYSKESLQNMRNDGWELLLNEVVFFCTNHEIDIPNMEDNFALKARSRRKLSQVTNVHYYKVELFCNVIDMQLQELNDRFSETTTELLACMNCFKPNDGFISFEKDKLLRLAQFYPYDFSPVDWMTLEDQLDTYIWDMRSSNDFAGLKGIGSLAEKLVKTGKHNVYPLTYKLLKLALTLPITSATVERAFSAMNVVKNRLRNEIGDNWMNDCLITYIEHELFETVDNESIIQYFQNMSNRRGQI